MSEVSILYIHNTLRIYQCIFCIFTNIDVTLLCVYLYTILLVYILYIVNIDVTLHYCVFIHNIHREYTGVYFVYSAIPHFSGKHVLQNLLKL